MDPTDLFGLAAAIIAAGGLAGVIVADRIALRARIDDLRFTPEQEARIAEMIAAATTAKQIADVEVSRARKALIRKFRAGHLSPDSDSSCIREKK